jgi:15-cis-phytoene synthase
MSARSAQYDRAVAHCRDIAKRRARNFYYGLKLSPEPQRSALFVVYAWMREADDMVDGASDHGADIESVLQQFRAKTDAALAGQPISDDPLWIGLAAMSARFHLPRETFHSMLDGQLDDLARKEYVTFDDLRSYCYRVASTVGLLCIEIWGYENDAARELAIDRGIAFQLTNIIRDYAQDFDAGRVYLPREDFAEYGLTAESLRRWENPSAGEAILRKQLLRAEVFYDQSAQLDEFIAPACRPTLWAMTAIYQGLLRKMQRNVSRIVLARRMRLSSFHKGVIAIRAQWQVKARLRTPELGTATAAMQGSSGG